LLIVFREQWEPGAIRELAKLPSPVSKRILKKMDWYIEQADPLHFAKALRDSSLGEYRFRIGDYRVLCDVQRGHIAVVEVLTVRHRKHAYSS
jgi:mRNA interferase RelE/StbE